MILYYGFRRLFKSSFPGQLPSFRQNLKDFPGAFRKKLGGSLDKTCRMLFPYSLTIFRAGVERFMQYDIPHDMITKSAAELMLVLIAAERKSSVNFFLIRSFFKKLHSQISTFLHKYQKNNQGK